MEQIRTELKRTGTISLNDTDVRKLAGRTSGTISMADLRGKSYSESVTNYQLYNNTWKGKDVRGNFTVTFPHKVISGYVIVTVTGKSNIHAHSISILGDTFKGTKNFEIPEGTLSINGSYFTSHETTNAGSKRDGEVSVNIKFTGEWEL